MKPQTLNSKLQGNSNSQALNGPRRVQGKIFNSAHQTVGCEWVLNDEPPSTGAALHPFDLEERTAKFGEAIIRFTKKIPRAQGNDRLIDQLVGCGTSVGANYREANESVSKKDFTYSISRCVKEASETKFFLRMVAAAESQLADEARSLYREGNELHLIFANIFRKGRSDSK